MKTGLFNRVRSWLRKPDASDEGPDPADSVEEEKTAEPVSAPSAADAEAEKVAAADPTGLASLALAGLPQGPTVEVAIGLLRRFRGTTGEGRAVSAALEALGRRAIPDAILVACADILAARGDEQGALRVLTGTTSIEGLLLSADLFASSGQLARAASTIERVLSRDIAAPGARERHERYCTALGYVPRGRRRADEATVVRADVASSSFRLLQEVARGGAGVVYEAEDPVLGRRVAFKVYHGRGADRALLERETRMATRLAGPGVLRVFDANPAEGWVALEWIRGGSLRDRLRKENLGALLPIRRWVEPLARALARVHTGGVVHADVKPANVLLRAIDDPVLGDFGIARPIGAKGDGGSPGYVSPERLSGRASDPRDDVYGFGRVLEDVLTRLDEAGVAAVEDDREAFRELALRCLGAEDRPADGAGVVAMLGA